MQFISVATMLFSAVAVYAMEGGAPQGAAPAGNNVGNTAQACGNGQALRCCNHTGADNSILGGACELPVLGQSCAGNQGFCCNANEEGLVNVGSLCVPVTA